MLEICVCSSTHAPTFSTYNASAVYNYGTPATCRSGDDSPFVCTILSRHSFAISSVMPSPQPFVSTVTAALRCCAFNELTSHIPFILWQCELQSTSVCSVGEAGGDAVQLNEHNCCGLLRTQSSSVRHGSWASGEDAGKSINLPAKGGDCGNSTQSSDAVKSMQNDKFSPSVAFAESLAFGDCKWEFSIGCMSPSARSFFTGLSLLLASFCNKFH